VPLLLNPRFPVYLITSTEYFICKAEPIPIDNYWQSAHQAYNGFEMEARMNKKPSQSIIPSQGGVLKDLTLRAKLMFRLMGDRRVSSWLKLIPIGALVYFISPIDLIPGAVVPGIGALDDVAILWFGYYMFLELCPPDVVRELSKNIISNSTIVDEVKQEEEGEIVDGEATDVTDK
jgi:uncharacterized membrane protein YkvA (DUF1232 family)